MRRTSGEVLFRWGEYRRYQSDRRCQSDQSDRRYQKYRRCWSDRSDLSIGGVEVIRVIGDVRSIGSIGGVGMIGAIGGELYLGLVRPSRGRYPVTTARWQALKEKGEQ